MSALVGVFTIDLFVKCAIPYSYVLGVCFFSSDDLNRDSFNIVDRIWGTQYPKRPIFSLGIRDYTLQCGLEEAH